MLDNRGISPLIATVLLIAFSVALGAVVMSYGESYVEERAEFATGGQEVALNACNNVKLSVITVKGVPQACVAGSTIEVLLDNGAEQVDGIQARVVGTSDIFINPNILTAPLAPITSLKARIVLEPIGSAVQLRLTPLLQKKQQTIYCADNAVIVDELAAC